MMLVTGHWLLASDYWWLVTVREYLLRVEGCVVKTRPIRNPPSSVF